MLYEIPMRSSSTSLAQDIENLRASLWHASRGCCSPDTFLSSLPPEEAEARYGKEGYSQISSGASKARVYRRDEGRGDKRIRCEKGFHFSERRYTSLHNSSIQPPPWILRGRGVTPRAEEEEEGGDHPVSQVEEAPEVAMARAEFRRIWETVAGALGNTTSSLKYPGARDPRHYRCSGERVWSRSRSRRQQLTPVVSLSRETSHRGCDGGGTALTSSGDLWRAAEWRTRCRPVSSPRYHSSSVSPVPHVMGSRVGFAVQRMASPHGAPSEDSKADNFVRWRKGMVPDKEGAAAESINRHQVAEEEEEEEEKGGRDTGQMEGDVLFEVTASHPVGVKTISPPTPQGQLTFDGLQGYHTTLPIEEVKRNEEDEPRPFSISPVPALQVPMVRGCQAVEAVEAVGLPVAENHPPDHAEGVPTSISSELISPAKTFLPAETLDRGQSLTPSPITQSVCDPSCPAPCALGVATRDSRKAEMYTSMRMQAAGGAASTISRSPVPQPPPPHTSPNTLAEAAILERITPLPLHHKRQLPDRREGDEKKGTRCSNGGQLLVFRDVENEKDDGDDGESLLIDTMSLSRACQHYQPYTTRSSPPVSSLTVPRLNNTSCVSNEGFSEPTGELTQTSSIIECGEL